MKKVVAFLAVMALMCSTAMAKPKQEKIAQTDLPDKSQAFLADYFAMTLAKKVVKVTADNGVATYVVVLKDKTSLEFDMVGAWSSVASKKVGVSSKILPIKVRTVIRDQFADRRIVSVTNDGMVYQFVFADKSTIAINCFGELVIPEVQEAPASDTAA